MLGNRLAEGLALLGVAHRLVEAGLGDADAARGHVDAAQLQAAESVLEALALDPADELVGIDPVVLEGELGRVDPAIAKLLELAADPEALAFLGEEQAHALVAGLGIGIGLDQEREAGAVDAVGDPGLGAVDDVGVVALALGRGSNRLQVGAAVGLGEREPATQLAAGEAGQVGGALLVGAEALDGGGHDEVGVDEPAHRHPGVGETLDDLGVGRDWQAEAAMVFGDGGAEQPHLLHLLDDVLRIDVVMLERGDVRTDVAVQEALDSVEDQCFLFLVHGLGMVRHCHFLPFPSMRAASISRRPGRENA